MLWLSHKFVHRIWEGYF